MQSTVNPAFSIVIPTHNTRDHVLAAIASSLRQHSSSLEIIVVDDNSADDTCAAVRELFPAVHLLHNEENEGFAVSANRGLARAQGEVLVLLNSDAELLEGSLERVAEAFDDTSKLAIAGAELFYPDGSPQWSGGGFPRQAWLFALTSGAAVQAARIPGYRWVKRPGHHTTGPVDWVTGAALSMTRKTWRDFGPLDEGYRFYAQDMDLCRRVVDCGLTVQILPGFRATHHHGATIGEKPGATGSTHPDLLWSDLLRFVTLHDGLRSGRRCRRMMLAGAWLRITTRRLVEPLVGRDRREAYQNLTKAYKKASNTLRNTSLENMIASAQTRV